MANKLQYSCQENIRLREKAGRPPSTGSQRVGHNLSDPVRINARLFVFACGGSAPVKVEHEGGAAASLVGTLVAPSVQGNRLSPLQELWPYPCLFSSLL